MTSFRFYLARFIYAELLNEGSYFDDWANFGQERRDK